jgi:hypothetical protein
MAPERFGLPILTIGDRRGSVPPTERPRGGTGLEVWRDDDGSVVAYGYRADRRYLLELLGVATYVFTPGSAEVEAFPENGISESRVADGFERAALPLVLQLEGYEVLHASGVLTAAGVVAFCATAGTGKSTLAYGMSTRGHALWADDAVPFAVRGEAISTFRLPFSLRLLPESVEHFGGPPSGDRPEGHVEAQLAAVCVVRRGRKDAPAAEIVQLSPREAFVAVLPHAYAFTAEDAERNRRMVEAYGALANKVPVFSVAVRRGFEHLDEVLHELDSAVAPP